MRLIILTYDYTPNSGGIARLCTEIRKQCIATQTDHIVITPVQGPAEKDVVRITGKRGIVELKILRYLKKIKQDDDMILTGTYHPDGLLAWLSGIPCFFLAHGAEVMPYKSFFRRNIWKHYRRRILSHAVKVIANSNYTAELVKNCSPKANVVSLPLAVDNQQFRPTKPKCNNGILHLFSVSRLFRYKAHDFIIDTIAELPKEYKKSINLTIGGNGPYKNTLEELVKKHNLNDCVSFVGFIPEEQLCDYYSESDVFILCSREDEESNKVEGFGLVFLEAQACGTPCIGTHIGGISDAIHDGNGGWLIPQDDKKELSSLLIKLIDNPSLIQTQGQKALKRISEEYTWNIYFHKILDLICFQ